MIRDKFLKLQGWMVEQLGLTANELIIYSIVYSYVMKDVAQMEIQIPTQAFVEWTGLSSRQVMRICDKLCIKGFLKIREETGKANHYSLNYELVEMAKNGKLTSGNKALDGGQNVTPDKMSPLTSMSKTPDIFGKSPLTSMSKTPDIMSGVHPYITTITTKNTTYNSACVRDSYINTNIDDYLPPTPRNRKEPSSLPTDTEKTRIQLEALKAMSAEGYDTSEHDVLKEFPEAYASIGQTGKKHLTELEKALIEKSFDWLHL
jgi:hypothetical protein